MTDRLTWTDEPPTEPGWYWLRTNPDVGISPRVVKVIERDASLRVNDTLDDAGIDHELGDYDNYQWAGPIPQPVES